MEQSAVDLSLRNMSRVLLRMWKTISINEGENFPRRNRLGLVIIALTSMCPLKSEPMRLPILNHWLVFYGGLSNLVVLTSQWKFGYGIDDGRSL